MGISLRAKRTLPSEAVNHNHPTAVTSKIMPLAYLYNGVCEVALPVSRADPDGVFRRASRTILTAGSRSSWLYPIQNPRT